jgi:membrane protein DedA with SNARE-associated domain
VSVLTSLQPDAALSYLIAFVLPALDAVLPVVPSETAIITLGVATAGSADPRIALLMAVAAAGAFAGDSLSYFIGRRFGPAAERRFLSSPRGQAGRRWAEKSLARHGMLLIIVARFIPGGRTAVTLTCGLIGYRYRRFALGTGIAAVVWVLYAFFIGRLGGRVFEDNSWAALLLALGVAGALAAVVEGVRRLHARRPPGPSHTGPDQAGPDHEGPDQAGPVTPDQSRAADGAARS